MIRSNHVMVERKTVWTSAVDKRSDFHIDDKSENDADQIRIEKDERDEWKWVNKSRSMKETRYNKDQFGTNFWTYNLREEKFQTKMLKKSVENNKIMIS